MSAVAGNARPHKRKGFWYLIRRVPREFVAYADRPRIQISTGIRVVDDPRAYRAREAINKLNADLVRTWEDKRAGRDPDAEARYNRARQTAQQLGFAYAPIPEGVSLPVDDILRRIEALEARNTVDRAPEIAAVLGGEPPPAIMLGTLVDEFETIIRASLARKSERQKKKWRVSRPKFPVSR